MKRPTGYHPDFDIDLGYGHHGEDTVAALLAGNLNGGTVEIKTKSYQDDTFYIEAKQDAGCTGEFVRSGISTTKATYWAFNVDNCLVFIMTTESIRQALTHRAKAPPGDVVENECKRGDNPTTGYLVAGSWLRKYAYQAPF